MTRQRENRENKKKKIFGIRPNKLLVQNWSTAEYVSLHDGPRLNACARALLFRCFGRRQFINVVSKVLISPLNPKQLPSVIEKLNIRCRNYLIRENRQISSSNCGLFLCVANSFTFHFLRRHTNDKNFADNWHFHLSPSLFIVSAKIVFIIYQQGICAHVN